jgi:hypothetical protein
MIMAESPIIIPIWARDAAGAAAAGVAEDAAVLSVLAGAPFVQATSVAQVRARASGMRAVRVAIIRALVGEEDG